MATSLRDRPSLSVPLVDILDAVRTHDGNQTWAADELGCSEGWVRKQLRLAGSDLDEVLAAGSVWELTREFR